MTLLGEQGRGDRRVDAARHGDDDAHRFASRARLRLLVRVRLSSTGVRVRLRSFSTMPGSTAITRSMSASVFAAPRLKRIEFCVAVRVEAHRLQHVRRLERARRTGRAGRHRDALEIERDQQRLGLDAIEADVGRVRHARLARAVDARCPAPRAGCPPRADRAARPDARPSSAILLAAIRAATPMPTMPGDVLGAGAAAALLPAAGQQRQHAHAALDPERADALRPVELVRRDRQQVDAERLDVRSESCPPTAPHRCGTARRARARSRASSAIGWIVPISLLACMTETSAVSSVSASRSASGETMPL